VLVFRNSFKKKSSISTSPSNVVTKEFDGKKMCWIPDHKEGFLKAEIQSTKGDDITVKININITIKCSFLAFAYSLNTTEAI
jgi:hypothetical protein